MSFIASDAFVAEYIHAKKAVVCWDSLPSTFNPGGLGTSISLPGQPHVGAKPLIVGTNVELAANYTEDMIGIVVRTAEYGTSGLDKNVFFGQVPSKLSPPGPNKPSFVIVAHHLPPNQNLNSTYVSDPNGSANRRGPVDDQWRVREYNPHDRAPYDRIGKTGVESPIPPYDGTPMHALMWNGDFSGVGQNRGNCLVHFGGMVGRMSYRVGGPFRPSSLKHEMTKTP
jgi:hypothetical protein